jgi:hypothetical protein
MNASEKATSLKAVSKIAAIINLFQSKFAGAVPDLTPWLDDPITRSTLNPDSIDIGFHFHHSNQTNVHHTLLLQIFFLPESGKNDYLTELHQGRVVGLGISSHSFRGCLWEFSIVDDWNLAESTGLSLEYQAQINSFCQGVLEVFNTADYSHHCQDS